MKNLKRVIAWAVLSIILQVSGLLYMDKVYLKHSSEFKIQKVEEKPNDINVTIPSSVEDIKSSTGGRYVSYFQDGNLMVANTKTGGIEEVTIEKAKEILYADWIPDVNRIMIAIRSRNNTVELVTYDASSKVISTVKEVCNYANGIKVDNIAISTKPGVKYVSISKAGYNANVYRIDINETMTKVVSDINSLEDMKAFQNKDILVYKDKKNSNFYYWTNNVVKKLNINDTKNLKLLAVDSNDNVYFGELQDGKIAKIIHGDKDGTQWTTEILDTHKNISDIYINSRGEILINDNLTGTIKNKSTNESISYEGRFLGISDRIVSSSINDKLYIKSLVSSNKAS